MDTSRAGEDRWTDLLRSAWVRPPAVPRVGDAPQSPSEPHSPPRGLRGISAADLKALFAPSFAPRGDLAGAKLPTAEDQQRKQLETVSLSAPRESSITTADSGREAQASVVPPEVTDLVEAWRQEIQRDRPAPVRRVAMPRIDEVVTAPPARTKVPPTAPPARPQAPAAKDLRLPTTPAPAPAPAPLAPAPAAPSRAGSPRLVIDFGTLCSTAVTITTEAPRAVHHGDPVAQAFVAPAIETPRAPAQPAPRPDVPTAQIHQAWQRFEAKVPERPVPPAPPVTQLPRAATPEPRPTAHAKPVAVAVEAEAPKRQTVVVENIVSGAFRAIADAGSWIFGRAKTAPRSEPVPPKPQAPRAPTSPAPRAPTPRPSTSREETNRPKQRSVYAASAVITASRRGRERGSTPSAIQRKPKMDVHR